MAISKTTKRIAISDLYHDGNPRTTNGLKLDKMISSFELHGYQSDSAIMVEEKSDGRFLVLRGNRRTLAAFHLCEKKPASFANVFPDGKIPAIVCKALTNDERIKLRIDHSDVMDREPLDEEGLYNAICQLCRIPLGQVEIAKHLNLMKKDSKTGQMVPNRSIVQRKIELAKLPQTVQDEYRILMQSGEGKGRDATPVRWSMIPALHKAFQVGYPEYPDGTMAFKELWEKCTTPMEKQDESTTPPSACSAKKARDLSQVSQSSIGRDILLSVTGQGKKSFADLDLAILNGETAIATLAAIKVYLGDDDYNALLSDSLAQESETETETETETVS